MDILREAKRLYDLGWAVHWIKPGSKAPVKAGWNGPTRDDWRTVKADYRGGYGLGVRLGQSSSLTGGGFLANIDVDVKAGPGPAQTEARAVVEKHFPGIFDIAPTVITGNGYRLVVRTAAPLVSGKIASSPQECKVLLPSTEINRRQLLAVKEGKLTRAELDRGYRIRPAWEVEFMSTGKQVVLPPSVHPETGKPYLWLPGAAAAAIPLVSWQSSGHSGGKREKLGPVSAFVPVTVDLVGSALSSPIVDMILEGTGVEDRSAACYSAALAMVRARFSDDEILSVLTDRDTFLGETAYDHRKTRSRAAAAEWVRSYCLRKARTELDASAAFRGEVEVSELDDEAATAQVATLVDKGDWKSRLERTKAGTVKVSLLNVVTVLENAAGPLVFRRNSFAMRDFYGCNTPWGGKKDEALNDDDGVKIKLWLGTKYGFEPGKDTIFDAMTAIAGKNSFHPVRDALEALPVWDGKSRLDSALKRYFKAKGPDEYLAQVFRKWLVASVARTYEPGLKFDWMLLLEGGQGTGKSSFGEILFGEDYFTDWLPALSDKDAALGLQGIRCVEFAELDQLKRNELETTKAFLTRRTDKVRPPYGRRWLESRRQCVFFGTTNKHTYLKDDSGNRRFNPVEVGRLWFSELAKDRDQLWAEAVFIYQNCLEPSFYLSGEAEVFSKINQENKMVEDESAFMEQAILDYMKKDFKDQVTPKFDFSRFRLVTLMGVGGPLERYKETAQNIMYASKTLKKIGAKRVMIRGRAFWKLNPKQLKLNQEPPSPTHSLHPKKHQ